MRTLRPRWLIEAALVLGVSLGESAVWSVLRILDKLTRNVPLSQQTTSMNSSVTPDRPWLDLAYQLANIVLPLVPVLLALYLLTVLPGSAVDGRDDPGLPAGRRLGFGLDRLRFDLGWGFAVFAGIGVPGLAFYLAAKQLGFNTTVAAGNLSEQWWTIPVYVLAATENGVLEEVIMLGYLFLRLRQWGGERWPGWWWVVVASGLIRGSYHLYQGFGGFIGNVVMGLAFGWLYLRWRRVGPLVVAHTLLDIVAFVGYALVAGRVTWL